MFTAQDARDTFYQHPLILLIETSITEAITQAQKNNDWSLSTVTVPLPAGTSQQLAYKVAIVFNDEPRSFATSVTIDRDDNGKKCYSITFVW